MVVEAEVADDFLEPVKQTLCWVERVVRTKWYFFVVLAWLVPAYVPLDFRGALLWDGHRHLS